MRVYGIARLTKELEIKTIGANQLVKTSVAWNGYKNEGQFHNIVLWNKTAERLYNFVKKGDRILIEGELSNNNYTNKDGVKVYQNVITVNSFEFIEKKTDQFTKEPNDLYKPKSDEQKKYDSLDIDKDSLPF